jgi:hypothetical protein
MMLMLMMMMMMMMMMMTTTTMMVIGLNCSLPHVHRASCLSGTAPDTYSVVPRFESRPEHRPSCLATISNRSPRRPSTFLSIHHTFNILPLKRPGRETDHSPPTCVEVKKMWIYTSTRIRLHGVVLTYLSTGTTLLLPLGDI